MIKLSFIFTLLLFSTQFCKICMFNLHIQRIFSEHNIGDFTVDSCFMKCLEQALYIEKTIRSPHIILKPTSTENQLFRGFVRIISQNDTILPHLIYDDVKRIRIEENSNVILFLKSSNEITTAFLEKLRYSHLRINIIYSNENFINSSEIRKIFDILPRKEFSSVTLLIHSERTDKTWRIFSHNTCNRYEKYRLIGLCREHRTGVNIQTLDSIAWTEKCILPTLVTNKKPFVFYYKKKEFYGGIEVNLMNTLAEKLNMTLNLILKNNTMIDSE